MYFFEVVLLVEMIKDLRKSYLIKDIVIRVVMSEQVEKLRAIQTYKGSHLDVVSFAIKKIKQLSSSYLD